MPWPVRQGRLGLQDMQQQWPLRQGCGFTPPRPTGVRAAAAATSPNYSEFSRSSPARMVKGPLTRIALYNGLACLLGRARAGWANDLVRSWPAGLRQARRLAELAIIANTAIALPGVELL